MVTLHVENTVRDYPAWRAVFDKFERFRADHGVRAVRVSRRHDDANQVAVDLEFDTTAGALAFREALEQIWRTPQSRAQTLGEHRATVWEPAPAVSAAAASGS